MSPSISKPHVNIQPPTGWADTTSALTVPLPRGTWLALLGGGQLGSMFCEAAQKLGYRVAAIDPDPNAPITQRADRYWSASYENAEALTELTELAEAATVEFENVPFPALAFVGGRIPLRPPVDAIAVAQDRSEEKALFARNGLPLVPYLLIRNENDTAQVTPAFFPARLKTTRMGYDGKGQRVVNSPEELRRAFRELGSVNCVLEKQIRLKGEISVLVARDVHNEIVTWPVSENFHKNGILDVTIAPARIPATLATEACDYARTIAASLSYLGVLCVEFFIASDDRLFLNEIAPRPHNSGHHTIESCVTSQFEQQARITALMPLGDTSQLASALMINLLGDLWFADGQTAKEPDWPTILRGQEAIATLHLYGKKEARRGRKMGHITCCATNLEEVLACANILRERLGMTPIEPAPKLSVQNASAPQQLWELGVPAIPKSPKNRL